MSLNNWLCKHFDEEKKGYVTIGNVTAVSAIFLTIVSVVFGIIYSIYMFFIEGNFYKPNPEVLSWHFLGEIVVFIGIICLVVVAFAIIIYIIQYAIEQINRFFNVKIAKCPLKEDDNK